MNRNYDPRRCIDWKALVPKPKPPKPPRRTERQREMDEYRVLWKVDYAIRWPTFGAFKVPDWNDAQHFRSLWYHGMVDDVPAMVALLPTDASYHDTYRELLRRHRDGDPELMGEMAELHLRRMAEIVAEAESP